MKMRSTAPMLTAKTGYVALSLVMTALGIAFIALYENAAVYLVRILGVATVLFGAVKIVGYLSKDLYRLAFQFDLEFGILLVVVGAALIIHPALSLDALSFALGALILADGLFRSRIALEAKRFGIASWWLVMALGVASGAAGAALIISPETALPVLTGASLIAEGALNAALAFGTVKIIKGQYPDIIDPDYTEKEDDER
ncbi:MAG: DUF308 domain-containing protein [Clostridia bacterium]|nr:DUF308 domain-containing protein [Clostridia bacterium]